MVNLNTLRKSNKTAASLVARQFLDNVFVSSGIPYDIASGADRQYTLLNSYLDVMVNSGEGSGARRTTEAKVDVEVSSEDGTGKRGSSSMKQARNIREKDSEKQVIREHTVTEGDLKK